MISVFFLPLGFDVLFLTIMKLTGSYWITDGLFYFLSASLFILYIFYSHKILLTFSLFFLPFGYDWLFKTILDYTGSYAIVDSVFYTISVTFFIIHFILTKTNPLIEFNKRIIKTKSKIINLKCRF